MKTKKLNKILFVILCLSAAFFVLTFFVSNGKSSRQKSFDSALVNPKYKDEISSVAIQTSSGEISIEKRGDFYLVKKDKNVGFADSKIAELMTENFCKIRRIYKIGSKVSQDVYKNKQKKVFELDFSLQNNTSSQCFEVQNILAKIIFYDSSKKEISDVNFTSQNNLLGRIGFYAKNGIFETKDDISHFLTTDFNYWSDGNLFPEVKNPVKVSYQIFGHNYNNSVILNGLEESVKKDASGQHDSFFSVTDSDENFSSVSYLIKSLRHGNLSSLDFSNGNLQLYSSLVAEDGGGRVSVLTFKKSPDGTYFLCSKKITPSPLDSKETSSALESQNAVFEISGWTVKSIESKFLQP